MSNKSPITGKRTHELDSEADSLPVPKIAAVNIEDFGSFFHSSSPKSPRTSASLNNPSTENAPSDEIEGFIPDCQKEIPIRFERRSMRKGSRTTYNPRYRNQPIRYRRLNVDDFLYQAEKFLNPHLMEIVKIETMSLKNKRINYSYKQKLLCANLFLCTSSSGYNLLRKIMKLPAPSTMIRFLQQFRSTPGVSQFNIRAAKCKLQLQTPQEKLCTILMDEVSLRAGLSYDSASGRIVGYADDGSETTRNIAKYALVVMVSGLVQKWKFPVGYYFSDKIIKAGFVEDIIRKTAKLLEDEEFNVMAITSDQCSNYEKLFKNLNCSINSPTIEIDGKELCVFRDPPHLLKSARNLLLNHSEGVPVPGFETSTAKWSHIVMLHEFDSLSSTKMVPKITSNHVRGLQFGNKMKVNVACRVMSNTCSAALTTLVESDKMPSDAIATSTFVKFFNDIFDIFNSSTSLCKVPLRRPLRIDSQGWKFLAGAEDFLTELSELNSNKIKFISGWLQNIRAIKILMFKLQPFDIKYLCTRNLCQDPLELLFSKIRLVNKTPNPKQFSEIYAKIATGSLIRAPVTANCEETYDDVVGQTATLLVMEAPATPPVPFFDVDPDEVLSYGGSPDIGSVLENTGANGGMSYFCGFLAHYLNKQHLKMKSSSLIDCETCCNLLAPCNLDLHLFINIKQYNENVNPN